MVVNLSLDEATGVYSMDKTAAEVIAAFPNVKLMEDWGEGEYCVGSITTFRYEYNQYTFLVDQEGIMTYVAASDNDYPHTNNDEQI